MNNEEKAKNIAKHILENYPVINRDNLPNALLFAAVEMAEWKEQQMIKKAYEWLEENIHKYREYNESGFYNEKSKLLFDDFKKAMK